MNFEQLKLEENDKLFFVSDWHLGESEMAIMQRPFSTPVESFAAMVKNHNAYVDKNDLTIFVGDAVSKRAENKKYWLKKINEFNGRKWLIRGNHDEIFSDDEFSPFFEKIISHGDGIDLDIPLSKIKTPEKVIWCQKKIPENVKSINLHITHYPTRGRVDRFNICGHVHGAWKVQKNMLNVGVDVNHFFPFSATEIPFYITAIKDFYDGDVWVYNYQVNKAHESFRGKTTSYFDSFNKND